MVPAEVHLETEGPEYSVFRVVGSRIHCKAFFASRHEADIRKRRLEAINLVPEEE